MTIGVGGGSNAKDRECPGSGDKEPAINWFAVGVQMLGMFHRSSLLGVWASEVDWMKIWVIAVDGYCFGCGSQRLLLKKAGG
jgi:hypothetical protein